MPRATCSARHRTAVRAVTARHSRSPTVAFAVGPTIAGAVANQPTTLFTPIHPFASVVIGEVPLLRQTETITITRIEKAGSAITNAFIYGVLSDPRAATDHRHTVNGVYMVSGWPAAVMAALQ